MIATKRVLVYRIFRIPWGVRTMHQHDCGGWYDPDDKERGYYCGYCGKNLVTGRRAEDYLCPNCVTPWKCNGPHIPEGSADAMKAEQE